MYNRQSSLGESTVYKAPRFNDLIVAQITGVKDFANGFIEAKLCKDGGGVLLPVRVTELGGSTVPKEKDYILIGFVDGYKNAPYLICYLAGAHSASRNLEVTDLNVTVKKQLLIVNPELTQNVGLKLLELESKISTLEAKVSALESASHSH